MIINRANAKTANIQKQTKKCGGCEEENSCQKDSFVGGFKLGLGYLMDPVGVAMESFENTFVDGKSPKHNIFKSAFMDWAGDKVHDDHSLSRYAGEAVGIVTGSALQAATGGVIAVANGLVSFGAGLYGSLKTLGDSSESYKPEAKKPEGTFGEGFQAGFGVAIDPYGVAAENAEALLIDGKGMHENSVKTVAEDLTADAHKSRWSLKKVLGTAAGFASGVACDVVTGGLIPVGTALADVWKTLTD